jgi:predicted cupin superfamily sugar epimerase
VTVPALAAALDLAPHPEGGWYRRTWTSTVTVDTPHGPRPSATAILYLLDGVSRWHRVRSAELWCGHRGSPIVLCTGGVGDAPADAEDHRLDADHPQVLVPAGTWQTARLLGTEPALVTCVVSPGFDFADFTLADPAF